MTNSENSITAGLKEEPALKEKLWTPNFLVLWQGQLVSMLGDAVYSLALGFWVLAKTGSTALMGTLMAASILPGVLVAPFAGVFVDRHDRKRLLVIMDAVRGISVVLVGIAAYLGFLEVWMVFISGILLSICGALFSPGVNSSIPDIVPQSKLTNANSMFSMVSTGSNILGNAAGGFLFQLLGAPFMFLFNGLSFLFSGTSILFVKIPKVHHNREKQHFFKDMKDGFQFVWKFKGLKYMLFLGAVVNFFAWMGMVLVLPLFQQTPELGPGNYGVAMACFMGGMFMGFMLTSIIKIPASKRADIFIISNAISNVCAMIFGLLDILPLMLLMILLAGFFNSIINVFFMSSVQLTVPQEMRGKIFSLVGMILQGLMPLGMALGGILGGFIQIRVIIIASFAAILVIFTPFKFVTPFRKFINFDPQKDTLEEIMR